jgi:ABC-type amino acid transport substrate-binding protein
MLGEGNGRFRDQVHIYPNAIEALQQLEAVAFDRLPRAAWAIGMAVRKDNVELARRLQSALNDMAASGELKAVFAQHGVQVVKP